MTPSRIDRWCSSSGTVPQIQLGKLEYKSKFYCWKDPSQLSRVQGQASKTAMFINVKSLVILEDSKRNRETTKVFWSSWRKVSSKSQWQYCQLLCRRILGLSEPTKTFKFFDPKMSLFFWCSHEHRFVSFYWFVSNIGSQSFGKIFEISPSMESQPTPPHPPHTHIHTLILT